MDLATYVGSVGLRVAGLLVGFSIWGGLIIIALSALDTGISLPEQLENIWPFVIVGLVVLAGVYLFLRRAAAGPGWGMFLIGVAIPFVALFATRAAASGEFGWFWVVVAVATLFPIPNRRTVETA